MRTTLLAPALVACVLAAACIPTRDNRYDPQSAPAVHARVVELTHAGSCPRTLGTSYTGVGSATRIDCLAVDARETTDAANDSTFSFEFTPPEAFSTISGGLAVVNSAWLLSRAPGPLQFQVKATNPAGDVGIGSASVTIDDVAPVALLNGSRTLPLGGFAWDASGSGTIDVLFDGSKSYDPDASSIAQYCWTIDSGTEACGANPTLALQVSKNSNHRTVASLRVLDATGVSSRRATTFVTVSSPNTWMVGGAGGVTTVSRIDNAEKSPGRGPAAAAFVGTHLYMTIAPIGDAVSEFDWQSLRQVGGAPVPYVTSPQSLNALSLAYDEGHDVLVAATDYLSTTPTLEVLAHAPSTLAVASTVSLPGQAASFPGGSIPRLSFDRAGNVWIAGQRASTTLWRVTDPAGAGTAVDVGVAAGRAINGLDARPESGETWAVETRDFLAPGTSGATGPARILRWHDDGTSTPVADAPLDLGVDVAGPLFWTDATQFWLVVADEGLRLVDAAILEATDLDAATVMKVPMTNVVGAAIDPGTGSCWVFPAAGDAFVVDLDGSVRSVPSFAQVARAIDPAGATFFSLGNGALALFYRGFAPGSHVVASVSLASNGPGGLGANSDPASGGVWTLESFPTTLVHLGNVGKIDVRMPLIDVDGTPEALNGLLPRFVTRDGASMYAFERDGTYSAVLGLLRVDTAVSPPTAHRVLDAAGVVPLTTYLGGATTLFGLATPTAAAPFFWGYDDTAKKVLGLSTSGAATGASYTIPEATHGPAHGAVTDVTGSLCLADADTVTPTESVRLRAVSPAGTATLLQTLTVNNTTTDSGFVTAISGASGPAGDACFVAFACTPNLDATCNTANVGAVVVGYFLNGTIAHASITLASGFYPLDMIAVSPDELWVKETNYSTNVNQIVHYVWNGSSWDSVVFFNPTTLSALSFVRR